MPKPTLNDAPIGEPELVNEVDEPTIQTVTITIPDLMSLIDQRDHLGAQIDAHMAALGLDAKALKKIVKAKAEKDAADKTLAALMAGGFVKS